MGSIIVKPGGGHKFMAFSEEDPENFETGYTAQDALGKLMLRMKDKLRLKVITEEVGHNYIAYFSTKPEDFESDLSDRDALAKLILKHRLELNLDIMLF